LWSAKTGLVPTGIYFGLGSCQVSVSRVPVRINERGEIGGSTCGKVYLWSAKTGISTLATLDSFSIYEQVVGLTDQGEIAGTTYVVPHYEAYYASARTGAVILPFSNMSVATDMNESGELIGYSSSPFYWSLFTGVIPIDAGPSTEAYSIARDGTVLGRSQSASGEWSLFLWDRHKGVTATAPLDEGCSPYRATSSGLVVGACGGPYAKQMWTWTVKAGYRQYDLVPAFTFSGMNESGEVAGTLNLGYPLTHAYMWSAETGLVDLDPGRPDRASSALAIASDGTIGGAIGPDATVWFQNRR
jgi:hypothetical protein